MQSKHDFIQQYRSLVLSANKELPKKEHFKDLLHRLYGDSEELRTIISRISSGSEKAILNIPKKEGNKRGSADSLFNKVIIEFENDLNKTGNHAKEQLAEYLLGSFKSGEGYDFTLIASDLITWKVYYPSIDSIQKMEELTSDGLELIENISAGIKLTEHNSDDFYYWIDRYLFKEEKQRATLERIEDMFGYHSQVFIHCFHLLNEHFRDAKKYGEVQVSFDQWNKFLSIAYGTFDASESNFIIHTYLSIFSKMLAYSVLTNDDFIDDEEMKGIIDGTIFHKYNVQNFVDNDFYFWVKQDRSFRALKKVFRTIAQEIANFDFSVVDEDILKGVYQELIDLDTRHALGEYYTPDWLCESIVNEFKFEVNSKILDPACGSGSFLRVAIDKLKSDHPEMSVVDINSNIYGIDIHPLSVQIAKTTLLLALGKDIINAKKPISLNIYLANTLLGPDGVDNIFGSEFSVTIDKKKLILNTLILDDVNVFDQGLTVCEELAEISQNKNNETIESFTNSLKRRTGLTGLNAKTIESFYLIYKGFKEVKENKRDSIWKFIVQNLYKPYFLKEKFDFVIGNPPWFTYNSIRNEEYQNQLKRLATDYYVMPDKVANFPHLEIAAIFLVHCTNYFLKKENGKIAFVLPRSFFSADHHDNTRRGKAKDFKIESIWDLKGVTPLFRIPSCVLFGKHRYAEKKIPKSGIKGKSVEGRLPAHNANLSAVGEKLKFINATWFYSKLGTSSAFTDFKMKESSETNPYKSKFKQGATIVPRNFYFVELNQEKPKDFINRTLNLRTNQVVKKEAKKPWDIIEMNGKMESQFLFTTALSKSILPFALHNPDLIALPVIIDENNKLQMKSWEELKYQGFLDAANWFRNVENQWETLKTEKADKMSFTNRIDFQRGLSEQELSKPYLVLYNSSAKDANSVVIDRSKFELNFVVDYKAYVFSTKDKNEAYFLNAFFNSNIPNEMMKPFQSSGLFGARDVSKKILDVPFQKFDSNDELHLKLAKLGENCSIKAEKWLGENNIGEISGIGLGNVRLQIKAFLKNEMKEIDDIVKKLME